MTRYPGTRVRRYAGTTALLRSAVLLVVIVGGITTLTTAYDGQLPADIPHPRGYVAYRAATPPVIDGRLDDAAWREAPQTDMFIDIEGNTKPRPRFETRARMMWDSEYFYVAAEMAEPHVWGTLTAHDSVIFHDPDFEVFIDPNGDNHEYYEFEINALGTYWDLLLPKPYKDDGKAVNAWEIPGLKSAVRVDGTLNNPADIDRGWTVELAFPWRVLGELARSPSPPREGDRWRVNFSRVEWPIEIKDGRYTKPDKARENNWVWSPQHVVDMHRPETWGYVEFRNRPSAAASPFAPDPAWATKAWLHRVYYAQREYRKVQNRWADSLDALGIKPPPGSSSTDVGLRVAGSQFEVFGSVPPGVRWVIHADSRLVTSR